ncbi:MAG: Hpt domain-containing protein [Bacteroidales bacterium]|jgi:two-component system chemotaxis sensor kinase CheA|nr:Hpt domain-containing protein [Bacteroidales bacterium]
MAIIEEDETLLAFTEEALEHLDGIEADLLSIEENGADIDSDVVNKVFRAVHSIKGGAGFLGLEKVKDLSHNGENVLNMIRNEELVPTPAIVSVLLATTDLLTSMIREATTSNDIDITTLVGSLKDIIEHSVGEENKEDLETFIAVGTAQRPDLFTINRYEYDSAIQSGKNMFLIEYDIRIDIEAKNKNPLEVINELQQTGDIFDSLADIASVGGLNDDLNSLCLPLFILFGTIMEAELLTGFLELSPDKVTSAVTSELSEQHELPPKSTSENESAVNPENVQDIQQTDFAQPLTDSGNETTSQESPPQQQPTATPKKTPPAVKAFKTEANLRVNVKILDNLMTLAGELVLTRNQLVQAVSSDNQLGVDTVSQRLDQVTSELQEAIMSTRMQPVGNVFNKFKRIVRDLTRDLGKNIDLIIEGEDVDLDKTIIEAI